MERAPETAPGGTVSVADAAVNCVDVGVCVKILLVSEELVVSLVPMKGREGM